MALRWHLLRTLWTVGLHCLLILKSSAAELEDFLYTSNSAKLLVKFLIAKKALCEKIQQSQLELLSALTADNSLRALE